MDKIALNNEIRNKVSLILNRDAQSLDEKVSLIDQGLDSYGFMELVTGLEEKHQVQFTESDLVSEKMQTMEGITELLALRAG